MHVQDNLILFCSYDQVGYWDEMKKTTFPHNSELLQPRGNFNLCRQLCILSDKSLKEISGQKRTWECMFPNSLIPNSLNCSIRIFLDTLFKDLTMSEYDFCY